MHVSNATTLRRVLHRVNPVGGVTSLRGRARASEPSHVASEGDLASELLEPQQEGGGEEGGGRDPDSSHSAPARELIAWQLNSGSGVGAPNTADGANDPGASGKDVPNEVPSVASFGTQMSLSEVLAEGTRWLASLTEREGDAPTLVPAEVDAVTQSRLASATNDERRLWAAFEKHKTAVDARSMYSYALQLITGLDTEAVSRPQALVDSAKFGRQVPSALELLLSFVQAPNADTLSGVVEGLRARDVPKDVALRRLRSVVPKLPDSIWTELHSRPEQVRRTAEDLCWPDEPDQPTGSQIVESRLREALRRHGCLGPGSGSFLLQLMLTPQEAR